MIWARGAISPGPASELVRKYAFVIKGVTVIPAKAGIQSPGRRSLRPWIPAFAGMTKARWGEEIHFRLDSQKNAARSAIHSLSGFDSLTGSRGAAHPRRTSRSRIAR